jgi:serine/threonine protein kinase
MFALGVTLFRLLTGRPPFIVADEEDPYYQLLKIDPETFYNEAFESLKTEHPAFDFLRIELKDFLRLIIRCFDENPAARPTGLDFLTCGWLYSDPLKVYLKRENQLLL